MSMIDVADDEAFCKDGFTDDANDEEGNEENRNGDSTFEYDADAVVNGAVLVVSVVVDGEIAVVDNENDGKGEGSAEYVAAAVDDGDSSNDGCGNDDKPSVDVVVLVGDVVESRARGSAGQSIVPSTLKNKHGFPLAGLHDNSSLITRPGRSRDATVQLIFNLYLGCP